MNHHLRDWLAKASPERRDDVAEKAGTSSGYLWQLAGGHRKPTPEIAERLQEASDGEITIAGLRPDLVPLAKKILQGEISALRGDHESHPTDPSPAT